MKGYGYILRREQLLPCGRFQKALLFVNSDEKAGLSPVVKNFGYDQKLSACHISRILPFCISFFISTSQRLCNA